MDVAATSRQPPADLRLDTLPLDAEHGLGLLFLLSQGATLASLRGLSPQRVEAYYALGYACFNAGRLADAQRIFSVVVMNDHLDRRYQLALGMVLQAQGRHEQALRPYGAASLADLTDPEPVVRMVECLLALGRGVDARQALAQALGQVEARPQQHQALHSQVLAILELVDAKPAGKAAAA